jgi:hypothetical protein
MLFQTNFHGNFEVVQEINSTIAITATQKSKLTTPHQRISLQQHHLKELQTPTSFQPFHASSPNLLFRLFQNVAIKIAFQQRPRRKQWEY